MKKLLFFIINFVVLNVLGQNLPYAEKIKRWNFEANLRTLNPSEKEQLATLFVTQIRNPEKLNEEKSNASLKINNAFSNWGEILKAANVPKEKQQEAHAAAYKEIYNEISDKSKLPVPEKVGFKS